MKITSVDLMKILKLNNLRSDFYLDTEKITTDTRKMVPGSIFFAIKGDRFDGNEYIISAIQNGAKGIISSPLDEKVVKAHPDIFFLFYKNDRKALYNLSRLIISKSETLKFAVTGSNGKTTTKDMLSSFLSSSYKTHRTIGNFNNDIGLPLTIFKLNDMHNAFVAELGMSALGEIENLSRLIKPDYSIITNVGKAHLEYLKTVENIARAKCEIFPHTKKDIVLCADSIELLETAKKNKRPFYTFSIQGHADLELKKIISQDIDGTSFVLHDKIHSEEFEVYLNVPGLHNISNFMPAYFMSRLAGLSTEKIIEKAAIFTPPKNRFKILRLGGLTLINDAYNANPDSMQAGLMNFAKLKFERKIAVLGDMLELGEESQELHEKLGEEINNLDLDVLYLLGPMSSNLAKKISKKGLELKHFNELEKLGLSLASIVKDGDGVFLKASNSMGLYKVEDVLAAKLAKP